MIKIFPPEASQLNDYYKTYLKYVQNDDMLQALIEEGNRTQEWISTIPSSSEDYAYADGKWMIKEVIGHLCDSERILSYRALRFARNDHTPLAGFDENTYMIQSNFKKRSLRAIADEWRTVRAATISLFSSMDEENIDRKGTANNAIVSPRILLYFILVHEKHHKQVIKDRYLSSAFSA